MKQTNEPRTPTEAQIDANRENAKKSTGPRTNAGKAASSRNRLLHGLRANKHILLDEDPEDFVILLHDHFDRFHPVGDGEEMLVMRIAADQWRLDRAFPMEAGIFRERLMKVAEEDAHHQKIAATDKTNAAYRGEPMPPARALPDEGDLLARAFNIDCAGPNSLANLARYESALEHSIDRSLRQLKTFQTARIASTPEAPEVEQPVPPSEPDSPPVQQPVPPAEPAATPPNSTNYHSNPTNEGIAKFATVTLMVFALLHAVPEFIVALASLLSGPKMNIFHSLAPAANRVSSPMRQLQPRGLHAA